MATEKRIEFVIPIEPKAQMRPRFARRGKFTATYKHKTQEFNESILLNELAKNRPEVPLEGAITVCVIAYMPMPSSKPTWWKEAALQGTIKHVTKPDADNMFKFLSDCMTNMGYFHDDNQISRLQIRKEYSVTPRWDIMISAKSQPTSKKDYEENYRN